MECRATTEHQILFLEKGADANYPYNQGSRPLNVAIDNLEIFKFLLTKGADPNGVDISGEHPLVFVKEKPELIDILLDNGSIPRLQDMDILVTTILREIQRGGLLVQNNIDMLGKLLSVGPKIPWSNSIKQLAEELELGYLFSNIKTA